MCDFLSGWRQAEKSGCNYPAMHLFWSHPFVMPLTHCSGWKVLSNPGPADECSHCDRRARQERWLTADLLAPITRTGLTLWRNVPWPLGGSDTLWGGTPSPAASEADDQRRVQVRWRCALARSLPDLTSVTNNWLTKWSKHMSQFSRTQPLWTNMANSPRMHCHTKRSRSNWIRADLELISIDSFCLFTWKHSTAASNGPCRTNRLHTFWMDVSGHRNISEPCPRFSDLEFSIAVPMNRLDADSCVYISDDTASDQQMLQTALLSVIGGNLGWFFISVTLHLL